MKNCSYCGRENADEATHCMECGTELPVEAPPLVDYAQNKSPSAGFGIRVLARLVDTVVGLFVGFAAGVFAIVILQILSTLSMVHPGWQYRLHRFSMIGIEVSLVGSIAYHYFCEGIHGSTLGKLCCGIRVVSEGGKPATLRGAFIRTVAYYIDGLFFGLVGYTSMKNSPLNQRYGDRWGKTVVVKVAELPPGSPQPTPAQFIIGLLAGLGCWGGLLVFGLVLKAL